MGINVKFWNYGNYFNGNYGAHCLAFEDVNGNIYYFSYETLVAFKINNEFHICKNIWGTTTGKHLNWINPDKSIREDEKEFISNYERLTNKGE